MTPKEKAINLVDKFNPYALDSASDKSRSGEVGAKQCALIAVDEILETCYLEKEWFFEEVKEEINKL